MPRWRRLTAADASTSPRTAAPSAICSPPARRCCLIGVDWPLARHAGELAEQHDLRGFDAVHLATALAVDAADLVLVTWDRDLARAAVRSGIAVAPS